MEKPTPLPKARGPPRNFAEPRKPLEPVLPPPRFSRRWFLDKFASWCAQDLAIILVQALMAISAIYVFTTYLYKYSRGWFHYLLAYISAALGYDLEVGPCGRLMKEVYPWRHLSTAEWWAWNKCMGNERGFDKQRNIVPALEDVFAWGSDPGSIYSSWVIFLFVLCAVFFWLKPLYRTLSWFCFSFCRLVYTLWTTQKWVFCFINFFATLALSGLQNASLLAALMMVVIRYHTQTSVTSGFTVPLQPRRGKGDPPGDPSNDPPVINPREDCHHVEACTCFVERDRGFDALQQRYAQLQRNNDAVKNRCNFLEDQAAANLDGHIIYSPNSDSRPTMAPMTARRPAYQGGNIDPSMISPGRIAFDRSQQRLQHRIEQLEQDKSQLLLEKHNFTVSYTAEFTKYKGQLAYAQGAGADMIAAKAEVDDLKAKIRILEREKRTLALSGMQTRQALAAEREIHSEKCQDEAGCQMKIEALKHECKRLHDSHLFHDKLVADAAINFGLPLEDAQHVDLVAYLSAITVEMARLKALGVQSLGATNTIDFMVKQLQDENHRITALKNRLEREVDRLGGDVIGIRNGVDTTKPDDWAININYTYEENANRIFPIYERLFEVGIALANKLTTEGVSLPEWAPEAPRNDQTAWPGFVALPGHLLEANKLTNRMITSSEDLTQKLTVNEVQRLYNRFQQVAIYMKDVSPKEILPSGESIVQDPVIRDMLSVADRVFKDVLVNTLDDQRPVTTSPTERFPDPRMQKKFEIYTAMQEAVQALTGSIVANGHIPPPWLPVPEHANKQWSSPDNLALNLTNHEMKTLHARMEQLMEYMVQCKLPGTLFGTPLLKDHRDRDYNARWYELVAATTYARLVISHWRLHLDQKQVQVTDEKGELKTITLPVANLMPLTNKDEFFRAALGRGESEADRKAREIKEGKWPHPDMIQATHVENPLYGPQIEFKVIDPNAKKEQHDSGNNNGKTHQQDENNSNPNDSNGKGDEKEKLRRQWETKKQRITQLKNHINNWNIRANMKLPNVDAPLKNNADVKKIERAIADFDEKIKELVTHIGNQGKSVPKMMHKGGKMWP